MIDGFYLDEENFESFKVLDNNRELTKLSKINIFIGANNSGKSRFLRSVFSNSSMFYESQSLGLDEFNNLISSFKDELKIFFTHGDIGDYKDRYLSDLKIIRYVNYGLSLNNEIRAYFYEIANINIRITSVYGLGETKLYNDLVAIGKKYLNLYDDLITKKSRL